MRYITLTFILVLNYGNFYAQEPVEDDALITDIIIYGSDACHYCVDTKGYLKEQGVAFKFYDIDNDEVKLKEMLSKLKMNNMSAANIQLPVIDKNGELFMNESTFEEFLKKLIHE